MGYSYAEYMPGKFKTIYREVFIMIKLVVFDLDGVLVEAKEIHYKALNFALEQCDKKYVISAYDHATKFDGLPTRIKLQKLTEERGLDPSLHQKIWQDKQNFTSRVIKDTIFAGHYGKQRGVLRRLKEAGYMIYCASNSIRQSIELMLECAGYTEFIDYILSNEDVQNPKPHSEMYLKCMIHAKVNPKETLIVEDSHVGRQSAHESGAYVLGVNDVSNVNIDNVFNAIKEINKEGEFKPKWQDKNMNVLIPMAGAGSRFEQAGYTFPKPLIDVNGKPMIQAVVENLNVDAKHIFIVQKSHYEKYNLYHLLNLIAPNCDIIQVEGITEGAACTTLLAKTLIDNDKPLLMANSDQLVEWNSGEFLYSMQNKRIDGGILTFNSYHPQWSFAKINELGYVTEVAEKRPISNLATVGVYYWKHGSDYVKYAEQMINKNIRTNNEFYVCPVFNEAVQDGKLVKTYHIDKMYGIGTPEDLNNYLRVNS
jgi:beta-phosphoglucomutase-like phosphatase (HAD superfamily)/dTDP-glucose pyrophosphorylase